MSIYIFQYRCLSAKKNISKNISISLPTKHKDINTIYFIMRLQHNRHSDASSENPLDGPESTLTLSFFLRSGVMKPFFCFLALCSSRRLRTSAFLRSISSCFFFASCESSQGVSDCSWRSTKLNKS